RFATNPQRVQLREELVPRVEALLRRRPTAEWLETLTEAGIPHAPARDHAEVFADPQAAARGLRLPVHAPDGRPVDLGGRPVHLRGAGGEVRGNEPRHPPEVGQHTDEVLAEWLGYDADRVRELRAGGAAGGDRAPEGSGR